ncbi:MAG: NAD synthetase [Legionellales bacterium]|nr:MAG: NAD synthetase [Legionellales bacterium]
MLNLVYLLATALFIIGIKLMSAPGTAKKGNLFSAGAMLLAIITVLCDRQILDYTWIAIALTSGTVLGAIAAYRISITAMPQLIAILNGFGGGASLLVGAAIYSYHQDLNSFTAVAVLISIIIGTITLIGSFIAFGKLGGLISQQAINICGQKILFFLLNILLVGTCVWCLMQPVIPMYGIAIIIVISCLLGCITVLPIGGADMPIVISLFNSYSGLAACASGFAIQNVLLIVCGAIVAATGFVLTRIMCKAINRSLSNIVFSSLKTSSANAATSTATQPVQTMSARDAFYMLEAAQSVVIVPGYGLAVSQAQHAVKELTEYLIKNDTTVEFAIHPVAGRMPGHMDVLLAEANVPYDQLIAMDQINPRLDTIDVAIVIGANDTVNLAAKEVPGSPIYGMPIIEVSQAKQVLVIKRSMAAGFSGMANPLFHKANTAMLFGDAKAVLQELTAEFRT